MTQGSSSAVTGGRRQRAAAVVGRRTAKKQPTAKAAAFQPAKAAVLSFPRGLYGFPGPLRFRLFDVPESGYMFRVMQSEGEDSLVFALVDASLFLNYLPVAVPADLADVGLSDAEEAIWMVIANVPSTLQEATVNLKAPLLINPFNQKAKQVILDAPYNVRQPLVSQ